MFWKSFAFLATYNALRDNFHLGAFAPFQIVLDVSCPEEKLWLLKVWFFSSLSMTRVKDILTSNILRISVLFDIIIFYKTIASVHCKNTFDRQNQKCIFCDTIKLRNCVVQTALEYKQHELGAGFKLKLIYHY